jgi:TPR repeat protein
MLLKQKQTILVLSQMPLRLFSPICIAFLLLTALFSPDWLQFYREVGHLTSETPEQRDAIKRAVLSGYAERGYHVTRQVENPDYEIPESTHKILRWRLLVPTVARLLGLPDWATLGLAHLGCLGLVCFLAFVAQRLVPSASSTAIAGFCLIAGSTAPFFTSMGWLGYYDSLLALALLAVAFAEKRFLVIIACFLAPWIDERFVLGVPLALLVRLLVNAPVDVRGWIRHEAALPVLIVCAYSLLRLQIGGTGGSQTVAQYFAQFVRDRPISGLQRLMGAAAGLRAAWVLVVVGLAGLFVSSLGFRRNLGPWAAATAMLTGLVAVYTALDLSRSMVLLLPLVPLGWLVMSRHLTKSRLSGATLLLAVVSMLLPARHAFAGFSVPVDSIFHPSHQLTTAQNNLGLYYSEGRIGPQNLEAGLHWFQRAAENDLPVAMKNLGLMYEHGIGVTADAEKAVGYYRRAAELGHAESQNNLGAILYTGDKVPRDLEGAAKWIRLAAEQDLPMAQKNLGLLLSRGEGMPQDHAEAGRWFQRAANAGVAEAQRNLGQMYLSGTGVPKDRDQGLRWLSTAADQGDTEAAMQLGALLSSGSEADRNPIEAHRWFELALRIGHPDAQRKLTQLEAAMTPAELATARARRAP